MWRKRDLEREKKEKKKEIAGVTANLRNGGDAFWVRLRELLRSRGLDPDQTLLAQLHTEDTDKWLGIVVTPSRQVFQFMYDTHSVAEARIVEWTELTNKLSNSAFRGGIECALELVPRRLD